jgi:uncharacterized protein YbaP (TraB family)
VAVCRLAGNLKLFGMWQGVFSIPKFSWGLLSAIALISSPCQAQSLAPTADDSHMLWQIESPTNTVYLLGSLHLLSAEHYPLPAVMEAAFDDAEVVVLEADIAPEGQTEAAIIAIEKAQPEPGEALADVLSDETYAMAEQATEELGLPIAPFLDLEAWFFAISLVALKLMDLGFDPAYGVDYYFFEQAETAGKPLVFLETAEQQLGFLDQLSIQEQQQLTEQTIEEIDILEASFNEIVAAWLAGDAAALEELLLASFESYPQMQQILLTNRNDNWATQIETFLGAEDDYLVVVGSAHLVGPYSLVELLTEQGYQAKQL